MAIERPGGMTLTDRAMELANFRKGNRILDVGCGEGDTVNHLNELGMKAEGIEMSLPKISRAKELFPGINVKFGDGEFLDEYEVYTFDGVFMESVLSLINIPEEALHEAYCVMKKGGRLIIGDLYEKDPDPVQMKMVRMEAARQSRLPRKEGDCENRTLKYVDFRYEGAFYLGPLMKQLEEVGFTVKSYEDHSEELARYAEEKGGLEELSGILKTDAAGKKRDIGYFLIVAEKPLLKR